jgi:hypothetical protein
MFVVLFFVVELDPRVVDGRGDPEMETARIAFLALGFDAEIFFYLHGRVLGTGLEQQPEKEQQAVKGKSVFHSWYLTWINNVLYTPFFRADVTKGGD